MCVLVLLRGFFLQTFFGFWNESNHSLVVASLFWNERNVNWKIMSKSNRMSDVCACSFHLHKSSKKWQKFHTSKSNGNVVWLLTNSRFENWFVVNKISLYSVKSETHREALCSEFTEYVYVSLQSQNVLFTFENMSCQIAPLATIFLINVSCTKNM